LSILNDIKKFYTKGGNTEKILFVNTLVFIILQLVLLVIYLFNQKVALSYFAAGTFLSSTSSIPVLATKPWSIITHMFTHLELLHFLFNMLVFYFAGGLFVMYYSQRELWKLYLLSGLSGFILFVFAFNVFPVFQEINPLTTICGASASVMGILVAGAMADLKRKVRLFGIVEVEILWVVLGLLLLDLVSIKSGNNSGGHIGHLGGALFGFLFVQTRKKGINMTGWLDKILDGIKSLVGGSKKGKAPKKRFETDEEYNARKKANQKRIDLILDKISRTGYEGLTKEEKEFLFTHSQK
jgi:membrane associated rhomboid family serine protease